MKRDEQTFAIIGAAMEVHRQLGHGFLEAVYQEALAIEFDLRKILFQREAELPVVYKEQKLLCSYKADFICYGEVIVELKALAALTGKEKSQIIITSRPAISCERCSLISGRQACSTKGSF